MLYTMQAFPFIGIVHDVILCFLLVRGDSKVRDTERTRCEIEARRYKPATNHLRRRQRSVLRLPSNQLFPRDPATEANPNELSGREC
jgi:hypothetical protein